jgi:hypothetical protein
MGESLTKWLKIQLVNFLKMLFNFSCATIQHTALVLHLFSKILGGGGALCTAGLDTGG